LGLLTVGLLLGWPRLVRVSMLPAALIAVVATTAVAAATGADVARVDLPSDPLGAITWPRWPDAAPLEIGIAVLTVALVAGVESLLSAVAVDRLHDGPRADLNRELVAQGCANTVSGLLGARPGLGDPARRLDRGGRAVLRGTARGDSAGGTGGGAGRGRAAADQPGPD